MMSKFNCFTEQSPHIYVGTIYAESYQEYPGNIVFYEDNTVCAIISNVIVERAEIQ